MKPRSRPPWTVLSDHLEQHLAIDRMLELAHAVGLNDRQ